MALQDQLRELFLLDQQVRGMRSRLDAAIRRKELQSNRLQQLRMQEQELAGQAKLVQAKAASLEHQSSDIEQRIVRHREQMNSVKNNKEYSALLVEVNTLKVEKGKVEDQALEHMGQVEEINGRVAEVREKIAAQEALVKQAEAEVEEAKQEVGGKLDELTTQRDAAAEAVPAETRALFDRLARSYEGEAMAEVHEQDRRRMEYTCGGCFLSLPIERVNSVMMKPDQPTTCTNCGRILYMPQELREGIGSK